MKIFLIAAAIISSPSSAVAASIRGAEVDAMMIESSASKNVDDSAVVVSAVDRAGLSRDLVTEISDTEEMGYFRTTRATIYGEGGPSGAEADEIFADIAYFVPQDPDGNDMGCRYANVKVTKKDLETSIEETLTLNYAGRIALFADDPQTLEASFDGSMLKFTMDDTIPSKKDKMKILWNGVDFEAAEIKKVATAFKGKKEKFQVLKTLEAAGIFANKCDDAADMLSTAVRLM